MDRKRKIDLSDTYAKKGKAAEAVVDNSNGGINPWTNVPYSFKYHSILATRVKLPVYQFKDELIQCVKENQIVVVEGETGSGYVLLQIFS